MKNLFKTPGLSKTNYLKNKIFNIVKNENPGVNTLKSLKAFTLVELIIVITILAILSTIGFVSFQSYTKTTRDANRLETLRNIEKGLNIYQAKNNLVPETNSGITIFGSGEIYGYQGTFADSQSNIMGISKTPTDPQTGELYIYSTNQNKTKYQLLGFFENSDVVTYKVGNEALAADNTLKTPKVFGSNLGIVLDTNNESPTSNIYLTGTTNIKVIVSNTNQISGTGIALSKAKSSFKYGKITWGYYDPNCDLDDVVIGNQVWAGCNSTLGSGMEWGQTISDIGTNNLNGTIQSCYDYNGVGILTGFCNPLNSNMKSNSKANLFNTIGININGDTEYDAIWGKFYIWDTLSQNCKGGDFSGTLSNSNCACPSGRHIPSDNELTNLENYVNGSICRTDFIGYQCSGIGWKSVNGNSNSRKLTNLLKWPMSGFIDSGLSYNRGVNSRIWSSTSTGTNAYFRTVNFAADGINRNRVSKSSIGNVVRCIKD